MPGGTALAVDREVFSRAAHEKVTAPSPHHRRARRGGRAAVARRRRHRPAHLRRAWPRRSRARLGAAALAFYDAIAPIVATSRSITTGSTALSRYGKGDGDDYLNAPLDRAGYDAFLDALVGGRPVPGPRVRPGAVLRGMPAGRGDGPAGPGDAALRPDEAGRPSRSRAPGGSPTPWCSSGGRTRPGRCGTWSASRPGSGSRSSSGCSG